MNNTSKNTNSLIISTDGTINAFINGQAYTLSPGGYYYPAALAAAKERDYAKLVEAIDLDKAVKNKSNGKVTFEDGVLRYNGAKIDNKLSRRVLELVSEGYKLDPFIKFMELCYQNPNPTVIDNLYDFMETTGIMLDEDGWVVGWKKVREDGYDYYSGTVLYEVGKTVKIDISECDLDSRKESSMGLHVGSRNYAENLWHKGQGKLLLVRVNPEKVVCVPEYSSMEKLRACEIDVLEEFQIDKEYKAVYFRPSFEDFENEPYYECDCCDLSDPNDQEIPLSRDEKGRFLPGVKVNVIRDSSGRFCRK